MGTLRIKGTIDVAQFWPGEKKSNDRNFIKRWYASHFHSKKIFLVKLTLFVAIVLLKTSASIAQTPLIPSSIVVDNVPGGQILLRSNFEMTVTLTAAVTDISTVTASLDLVGNGQVKFVSTDQKSIAISFVIPGDSRLIGDRTVKIFEASNFNYKVAVKIVGPTPSLNYMSRTPATLYINEGFQAVKICGENLITLQLSNAKLVDGAGNAVASDKAVLDNSFSVDGNCFSFNINVKDVLPGGTKLSIPYKAIDTGGNFVETTISFPIPEYINIRTRYPNQFTLEPSTVYLDDNHQDQDILVKLPSPVTKDKTFDITAKHDLGTGVLAFLSAKVVIPNGSRQAIIRLKSVDKAGFYEITLADGAEKSQAMLQVFETPKIENVVVVGKSDLNININADEIIVVRGTSLRDIYMALIEDPTNAIVQFSKVGNLNAQEQVYRVDYADKTKVKFKEYNLFPYRIVGLTKKFYSIDGNPRLTILQNSIPVRDLASGAQVFNDVQLVGAGMLLDKWKDIRFTIDGTKFSYENGVQNIAIKALVFDEYGTLKKEVTFEEAGKRYASIKHPSVPAANVSTSLNWNLTQAIGRDYIRGFRRITIEGYQVLGAENSFQQKVYQQDYKIKPDNKEYLGLSISLPPFLWAASIGKRKITEGEGSEQREKTDRYFQSQVLSINTGLGIKVRLTKKGLIPTNDYLALYITGVNLGGEEVSEPGTNDEEEVEKFIDQGSLAFLGMYEVSLYSLDSGLSIPLSLGVGVVPKSVTNKAKGFFTIGFGIDIALGK